MAYVVVAVVVVVVTIVINIIIEIVIVVVIIIAIVRIRYVIILGYFTHICLHHSALLIEANHVFESRHHYNVFSCKRANLRIGR